MKINNKGITLTELIISIALISIVILFLFRLLVDVRHVNNDTDFDRENQQTRAIILKTIKLLQENNHEIALVIGGGNFFRGRENEDMEV